MSITWQLNGIAHHGDGNEEHDTATDEEADPPGSYPSRIHRCNVYSENEGISLNISLNIITVVISTRRVQYVPIYISNTGI